MLFAWLLLLHLPVNSSIRLIVPLAPDCYCKELRPRTNDSGKHSSSTCLLRAAQLGGNSASPLGYTSSLPPDAVIIVRVFIDFRVWRRRGDEKLAAVQVEGQLPLRETCGKLFAWDAEEVA
ncbi:Uncharacterized protein HZ326_13029 [Fusarium oxysporum f. sp. albedinis]|nr:Uncharacterized protein HZ326_13029 [Fusarium oxysporum f. sp. albedinis]